MKGQLNVGCSGTAASKYTINTQNGPLDSANGFTDGMRSSCCVASMAFVTPKKKKEEINARPLFFSRELLKKLTFDPTQIRNSLS